MRLKMTRPVRQSSEGRRVRKYYDIMIMFKKICGTTIVGIQS